jgi:hypothetical protein
MVRDTAGRYLRKHFGDTNVAVTLSVVFCNAGTSIGVDKENDTLDTLWEIDDTRE